jgi:DNA polymerase delta subunit 4
VLARERGRRASPRQPIGGSPRSPCVTFTARRAQRDYTHISHIPPAITFTDTYTPFTMPPKRQISGPTAKSQQSTLAFHGGANKVTKPGARAQDAKKNVLSKSAPKAIKPEVIDLETVEDTKPTTVEADIIDQVEKEVAAQKVETAPEDEAAKRITDATIKKYWTAKEKQRLAPRVHQNDINLHEKILREFDMSAQYGVSPDL